MKSITRFTPILSTSDVTECINLRFSPDGKSLKPMLPPPRFECPTGYRPIARLENDGKMLLARDNMLSIRLSDGTMAGDCELDGESLCVVPGAIAGTVIVMTRTRSYTLSTTDLSLRESSELIMPVIRATAETPVAAEMQSVQLSKTYSHGDSISESDKSRLTSAARELYENLDSNVRETNRYWQPVMARVRAISASGQTLYESEPRLFTHPSSPEWAGQIALTAATGGLSTNLLEVEAPTYSLNLYMPEGTQNSSVAAYQVLVTPVFHHIDISRNPSIVTPRRAGTQTLCTITFRPGILNSPAPAARPFRLLDIISRLDMLESVLVEIPCTELSMSGMKELPPVSSVDVVSSTKSVMKILAKTVKSSEPVDSLLSPPNSFTASVVACGTDTLLWGGVQVSRFKGWSAELFADSVTDAAWTASVEVMFTDGSAVVSTSSGTAGAPELFGPVLSYPSADAVSMRICLEVSGHTYREATFPLTRDLSGRRAVYINPGLQPFELSVAAGSYVEPQSTATSIDFQDRLLLCRADAPLVPTASVKISSGTVNALMEAPFGQSSWDFGRIRYYVFTSRGIYLLSASTSRSAMSISMIDPRIVNSPYCVASTERGVAAIASGDLILLSGSKATRIYRDGVHDAEGIVWVHDDHELWCVCPDRTEVLCFDSDMSRYTIPMAFGAEHHAGALVARGTSLCFSTAHDSGNSYVDVRWKGILQCGGGQCFDLKTLNIDIAGTFKDLKVRCYRATSMGEAPFPELELTLNGTVNVPIYHRLFLAPHHRIVLEIEGMVFSNSRLFKTVII